MKSAASFFVGEFAGAEENQPRSLDSCSLCCKPLRRNDDIFMYRGDTPFCSEECRHKQITLDEFAERRRRRSFNISKTSSSDAGTAARPAVSVSVRHGAVVTV